LRLVKAWSSARPDLALAGRIMGFRPEPPMQKPSIPHRLAAAAAAFALGCALPAHAGPITTFLNLPTGLSSIESNGSALLADDFVPAHTGWLHGAIWWGSSAPADSRWVVAIYASAAGHPAGTHPAADALFRQEFVGSFGTPEGDPANGLERFTVPLPDVLELFAGTEYWFSVVNLSPGWRWAQAGGAPAVGGQSHNAQGTDRTVLPGSPDCPPQLDDPGVPLNCYGPWADQGTQFAFQIIVPEPGSLPLAGFALALMGLRLRRAMARPPGELSPCG